MIQKTAMMRQYQDVPDAKIGENVSKQKKNKKRSGAFRRRKTSGRMSRKLVALIFWE